MVTILLRIEREQPEFLPSSDVPLVTFVVLLLLLVKSEIWLGILKENPD